MDRRECIGLLAAAALASVPALAAPKPEYEIDTVVPDPRASHEAERIVRNGAYAIRHRRMCRIRRRPGEASTIEYAEVGGAEYGSWLAGRDASASWPPHLVFVGSVAAMTTFDPSFHDRWTTGASAPS